MIFAIVTPSTLTALGLQCVLNRYFDAEAEIFRSAAELMEARPERFDAYFVMPDMCLGCIDFFLPRKSKTVLLGGGQATNAMFMSLDGDVPESDLIDAVDSCIARIGKGGLPAREELTPRETEVLRCVARGLMNKEIADVLCISVNTVLTHRKNITAKLGIKTVSGLSLYAMMNGLIESC